MSDRLIIIVREPHTDGEYVVITAGNIEIWAVMHRWGDDLVLDRLSITGAEANALGLRRIKSLGREFLRDQGAQRLRILGTTRTTGATPGKVPRDIIIRL